MHGPVVVGWLLVALCGGTGGYCLLRMGGGPARERQATAVEATMGLGMAAMTVLPGHAAPAAVLAALFAVTALWSAALLRDGAAHQGHHLVEGLAMVYMALAMHTVPGGHGGHTPGGVPALTGVLLVYFGVYALRTGPRLLPSGNAAAGPARPHETGHPGRPPEVAAACRLALAVGMFAMLLTL